MTHSLILAATWAVVANVLAMLPSRDHHRRDAFALIVVGIPILGYVTYQNGPWVGLVVLLAGMSVLRWPVVHLSRWMRKKSSMTRGHG